MVVVHHGGRALPAHFRIFVGQFVLSNPNATLWAVVDRRCAAEAEAEGALRGARLVFTEDLPASDLDTEFEAKYALNKGLADGYWQAVSRRFITVWRLAAWKNLSSVFHAEYDNLIYMDLQDVLGRMRGVREFQGAAGIFDSVHEGVASLVYFGLASLEHFVRYMVSVASESMTDMRLLKKYRQEFGSDKIGCLPVISREYAERHGWVREDDCLYRHAEAMGVLFDGRSIGQFIGGVDPSNIAGDTVGFVNQDVSFRADALDVLWVDGKPTACGLPVVNLHVHSKDLARWAET